jgi:hypothetical protein
LLLTEPFVALMSADPLGPGLQTVGVVVESHLPPHTAPAVLTSTMLALLVLHVIVWPDIVFPFWSSTVAAN